MNETDKMWSLAAAGGAIAALTLITPAANAEPVIPVPPPPPPPAAEQPITVHAAPVAEPGPPAEVPHLASPENLPPGTSDVPLDPPEGRGVSYLRDLWHAVQTQEISGSDALLLLTQRPLDPNAMPTNGLPVGPQPQPDPAPVEPAPAAPLPPPPPMP